MIVLPAMRTFSTLVLAAVATFALLSACSTEEPEYVAQRLTLDELNTSAGYVWFPTEMGIYTPNTDMVTTVSQSFTDSTNVVVFVRPACSCRGTQKLFPQVMKTLIDANIPMDKVEVLSMRGTKDRHPYMDRLSIASLPAVYVMKRGVIVAEVEDDDYSGANADTLIARAVAR